MKKNKKNNKDKEIDCKNKDYSSKRHIWKDSLWSNERKCIKCGKKYYSLIY